MWPDLFFVFFSCKCHPLFAGKKHTRKVCEMFAEAYPAMFKHDGSSTSSVPAYSGYGLGGLKGLEGLPDRLCDRFRDRKRKHKNLDHFEDKHEETDDGVGSSKRGKKPLVYGVSQSKWYNQNVSQGSVEKLRMAGKITSFEEREELFCKNRGALTKTLRNQQNMIAKACPGFFLDPRHLEEQFFYLTNSRISAKVEKNLPGQLENMLLYLLNTNTSVEFHENVEKIKEDCVIMFSGAETHKYIHILRLAGNHFDGDGSSLMRLESDEISSSPSPYIKAVRVGNNYVFELYVEKGRILERLDLAGSISALLHLVFAFNIKYPKGAETVCDFLQREVAGYGNDEGNLFRFKIIRILQYRR